MRDPQEVSRLVIGAAIEVHRAVGPGLLESAYKACLTLELAALGLSVESERALPLVYRGQRVGLGYRLDLLVDDCLVIEVKSVERLEPVHLSQLISYLRLSERQLGLLINFNVKRLADGGIRRVVNQWPG